MSAHRQRGYLTGIALLLIALLASLAALTLHLAGVSTEGSLQSVTGARAYYAADAGLHWGMVQVSTLAACPASTTLTLSQGGLAGLTATVQCSRSGHGEGGTTVWVYHLVSEGRLPNSNAHDATSRQLEITFVP